jgi:hypothetical protein
LNVLAIMVVNYGGGDVRVVPLIYFRSVGVRSSHVV